MSIDLSIDLTLEDFHLQARFRVGDGITALFGPSGAGKTLTLRSIAGLATPQSGRIAVAGRTLFDSTAAIDVPPRERGIGYLFQQYALFPHLTVERNVGFGLHRLSRSIRAGRVADVLALVGTHRDLAGLLR